MKKPLTYLSLLELNPVANFWILKKQNNPLIWMLHLSSYSHSCLVGLRASFYNFVLILANLETDVINRNIAFIQNLPQLSVVEATIYNQMMWNIELADKSCPENYVVTYISFHSLQNVHNTSLILMAWSDLLDIPPPFIKTLIAHGSFIFKMEKVSNWK